VVGAVIEDRDSLADLLLLSHAARRVLQDEVLAHFKAHGVNSARMGILRLLARRGKQSVNVLARFLGLSKAAASQNIDQLEQRGLASRHTDSRDRRTTWVEISRRGRRLLKEAEDLQLETFRKFLGELPPETRTVARDRLRELGTALIELSANGDETCLQFCAYGCTCQHSSKVGSGGCVRGPGGEEWVCSALRRAVPLGANKGTEGRL
jgi:MarR family 2-MHQ and catechol resistance regulon transcriptional repressor